MISQNISYATSLEALLPIIPLNGFYTELPEFVIGALVLIFLIGAVALWIGRSVANGFRPAEPQTGE
jgi:hypothetical protein